MGMANQAGRNVWRKRGERWRGRGGTWRAGRFVGAFDERGMQKTYTMRCGVRSADAGCGCRSAIRLGRRRCWWRELVPPTLVVWRRSSVLYFEEEWSRNCSCSLYAVVFIMIRT